MTLTLVFSAIVIACAAITLVFLKLLSIKAWRKQAEKADALMARLEPYQSDHAVVICDKATEAANRMRDWKKYIEWRLEQIKRFRDSGADDDLCIGVLSSIGAEVKEIEAEANGDLTARLEYARRQRDGIVLYSVTNARERRLDSEARTYLRLADDAMDVAAETIHENDRSTAIDSLADAETSLQAAVDAVCNVIQTRELDLQGRLDDLSQKFEDLREDWRKGRLTVFPENRHLTVMLSLKQIDTLLKGRAQGFDPSDDQEEEFVKALEAYLCMAKRFLVQK